jgi:hypothetical protein
MRGGYLRRGSSDIQSSGTAVVADAVVGDVGNPIVIHVDIAYHIHIYVGYGIVIGKVVTVPVTAVVAAARIAESIINAAIEAYVGAPVTAVPLVAIVIERPVGRGPKRSYVRRDNPGSRNPVVIRGSVAPVTGSP